jgi:hypothetical protein
MMNWVNWLFLTAFLGSINFRFSRIKDNQRGYFLGWFLRIVVFLFLAWFTFFCIRPAMVGPFSGALKVLLPFWIINLVWTCIESNEGSYTFEPRFDAGSWALVVIVCISLLLTLFHVTIYRIMNVHRLPPLAQVQETTESFDPMDPAHIRQVHIKTAFWLARKVIGEGGKNYGSIYRPGNPTIQRVADKLYWIFPLEFRGFFSRRRANGESPGFIKVSAEDPRSPAELVDGYHMRYMPGASVWTTCLHKYLYHRGYTNYRLTDFTLEVDDNWVPHWVVTLTRPTVAYGGDKVEGILIVDPETGKIGEYMVDRDTIPEWVDRVVPLWLAIKMNYWWGKYKGRSWWNANVGQKGVHIPTKYGGSGKGKDDKPDVWLTFGKDGQPYWFTGHTSPSSTDQSLVGYTMMNSRTGKTYYYQLTGANENDVVQAAFSPFSDHDDWEACQPVLYRIYGERTWVVPVINNEGVFQKLTLVQASTGKVVWGDNKREVLAKYRRYLVTAGSSIAPSEEAALLSLTGRIIKIVPIDETFYLYLDTAPDRIFSGEFLTLPELILTDPGDRVVIKYIETTEPIVPIEEFDNPKYDLQKSKTQERFEVIQEKQKMKEKELDRQKELQEKLDKLRGRK